MGPVGLEPVPVPRRVHVSRPSDHASIPGRGENYLPEASALQLLEPFHVQKAVGLTRMKGLARLLQLDSKWIVVPSGPGLVGETLLNFPWWLDVPPKALATSYQPTEGALVIATVEAPAPEAWFAGTPSGSLGPVSAVRSFSNSTFSQEPQYEQAFGVMGWSPAALDSAINDALDTMPADWPVYEIEGARPEISGWHTCIKTLRPVEGVDQWRGSIPASMLKVDSWLRPF